MPYLIGIVLSLIVALLARRVGFDRDRAFYPTVLIVVASYYVLFAAMGGESTQTVLQESAVMTGFLIAAVAGFKSSGWIVVAGLAGHGVLDGFHGSVLENPGVPMWWPAFCGAYDIGAAGILAWLMTRRPRPGVGRRLASSILI